MQIILIILGYIKWHYGKAILSLTIVWGNFISFISDFFSFRLLCKNLFDPWKRMTDIYTKPFNLKKYFYTFMTNLIVRIVGVIMRLALILCGLFCQIALLLLYPVAIISWLVLPIIVFIIIGTGLSLIFR